MKRVLSVLLAVLLIGAALPMTALANPEDSSLCAKEKPGYYKLESDGTLNITKMPEVNEFASGSGPTEWRFPWQGWFNTYAEPGYEYGGSWEDEIVRVVIAEGVTLLRGSEHAKTDPFRKCQNLTAVSIPLSLRGFVSYDFADCPKLTDVYYAGDESQWKQIWNCDTAFQNSPVTVHYNSTIPDSTPTPVTFTDVPTNQYYYKPVIWAVDAGITGGTGGGKFSPNAKCTRAQIVTFLWNFKDNPEPEKMATFSDMTSNKVFNNAISWAVAEGITGGVGNNKFGPGLSCTRGQAMVFLWNACGKPEPESIATFSDMPSSSVFQKAISWGVENKITSGTGNNKFSPNAPCTRAQIVTFLHTAKDL